MGHGLIRPSLICMYPERQSGCQQLGAALSGGGVAGIALIPWLLRRGSRLGRRQRVVPRLWIHEDLAGVDRSLDTRLDISHDLGRHLAIICKPIHEEPKPTELDAQ